MLQEPARRDRDVATDSSTQRNELTMTTTNNSILAVVSRIFPQGDYGFAVTEDGREVYFHHHVVGGHVFDDLRTGDTVQIELQQLGDDQHAHAVRMVRLSRST
jgi:cold shock CspA family protein